MSCLVTDLSARRPRATGPDNLLGLCGPFSRSVEAGVAPCNQQSLFAEEDDYAKRVQHIVIGTGLELVLRGFTPERPIPLHHRYKTAGPILAFPNHRDGLIVPNGRHDGRDPVGGGGECNLRSHVGSRFVRAMAKRSNSAPHPKTRSI